MVCKDENAIANFVVGSAGEVCGFVQIQEPPLHCRQQSWLLHSSSLQTMASWLFHNNGNGTFTDVSQTSGIGKYLGKAWGVVATDIKMTPHDLFVSNDTVANFLFVNRRQGTFEEIGATCRHSVLRRRRPRSGMGWIRGFQSRWLDGSLCREH